MQITYDSVRIKSSNNLVWGAEDSFVSVLKTMETFLDYALLDILLHTCIHYYCSLEGLMLKLKLQYFGHLT